MDPTADSHSNVTTSATVSGIVLAGSYQWSGSRFERLRPRPLLPVAQQPLIEHVLRWLQQGGVPQATICANGSTPALKRHFESSALPLPVGYHEDGSPRGAAGCVKDAAATSTAAIFLVADGTSIPTVDIAELLAHHRASGADVTLAVHTRTTNGQVQVAPTGIYVFNRDALDAVPATSFQDIKENLIPKMHREGRRIEIFTVADVAPRVLNAATYLAANHWMIQRIAAASPGSELVSHASAWIDPSATIIGPVLIGPGARVHASALIVGPTSIGAGTIVDTDAVVTRSVLWDDCVVGRGAVVDQSLLADAAVVNPASSTLHALRLPGDKGSPSLYERLSFRHSESPALVARHAVS